MPHSGRGVHLVAAVVAAAPLAPSMLLRVTVPNFAVTPSLTDQSSWFPRDKKGGYVEVPDPLWQPSSFLHVIFWHVYRRCSLRPPSGHWQSLGVLDGGMLGWRWHSHRHWVEAVTQHRQAPGFWHWSSPVPGMHHRGPIWRDKQTNEFGSVGGRNASFPVIKFKRCLYVTCRRWMAAIPPEHLSCCKLELME